MTEMPAPLRVGFVRMGPHPIPNRLLPPELASALDGATLEIFDVAAAARRGPLTLLVNALFVIGEYGWQLLCGRIRPWQAFFTTTWMFRRMSRLARRFIERGEFDLSFQIQSLFDARSPGTPHFVYTDHTHLANLGYPGFDRRKLRGAGWVALERDLYAGSSVVFTRSHHVSHSLVTQYGCSPEKVVCARAGSNARLPDDALPGPRPGPPSILFLGVDWERKGGPDLVAAFSRLRDSHPEARLTIVGCRPEVDLPNVDIVGPCPLESVHLQYRSASIFCLPVHREPFGVAIVEAMHHGLPVVATRVGAVPDLVQHGANGFLVEVGDVDELTCCLDRLLADPETREKMGERSLDRARAGYTWPSVAATMAKTILEQLQWSRCAGESS